jgi:hypothetical protein
MHCRTRLYRLDADANASAVASEGEGASHTMSEPLLALLPALRDTSIVAAVVNTSTSCCDGSSKKCSTRAVGIGDAATAPPAPPAAPESNHTTTQPHNHTTTQTHTRPSITQAHSLACRGTAYSRSPPSPRR